MKKFSLWIVSFLVGGFGWNPAMASDAESSMPLRFLTAVKIAGSEPWQFLGRGIVDTYTTSGCLWKTSQAILFADYCGATELQATNLLIYLPTGDHYEFYIEKLPQDRATPIAQFTAVMYHHTPNWLLTYTSLESVPNYLRQYQAMESLANYKDLYNQVYALRVPACLAGGMNQFFECDESLPTLQGAWFADMKSFWQNPPREWSVLLQKLREEMVRVQDQN